MNINLMQGDCLEKMKDIPDGSVDMVLTDPPYGTTSCKWDSVIPLEPMWEQLKRVIKPNGAIVMTASQPFTTTLISSNMKMFKYCWVWEKNVPTGHFNAKKMPLRNTEDVTVFYEKQPNYNPQGLISVSEIASNSKSKFSSDDKGAAIHNGGRVSKKTYRKESANYPRTIQSFDTERYTKHPTQKPVALMEYMIKTYTNEGETVLDFTMGSGTTGVACTNLNRGFIGIELDKDYFEIAKTRINESRHLTKFLEI